MTRTDAWMQVNKRERRMEEKVREEERNESKYKEQKR
jgi:hypothetical protein